MLENVSAIDIAAFFNQMRATDKLNLQDLYHAEKRMGRDAYAQLVVEFAMEHGLKLNRAVAPHPLGPDQGVGTTP